MHCGRKHYHYIPSTNLLKRTCELALPCVGAQVKDGSDVMTWTECKRPHNQYETSCEISAHPRECLYSIISLISLSIWPDYQYKYNICSSRQHLHLSINQIKITPSPPTKKSPWKTQHYNRHTIIRSTAHTGEHNKSHWMSSNLFIKKTNPFINQ